MKALSPLLLDPLKGEDVGDLVGLLGEAGSLGHDRQRVAALGSCTRKGPQQAPMLGRPVEAAVPALLAECSNLTWKELRPTFHDCADEKLSSRREPSEHCMQAQMAGHRMAP